MVCANNNYYAYDMYSFKLVVLNTYPIVLSQHPANTNLPEN